MNHQACWHKACRVRFSQTKLDRLQKKITKNQVENEDTSSSVRMVTRSSLRSPSVDLEESTSRCFFCDEPAGPAGLHNASTYDFDRSVRKCALQLEDTALLAKLSSRDMIATEAKYHSRCLVALRNRARSISSVCVDDQFAHLHGIAFAELVTYIEDFRNEDDVAPVFKLVDLAAMYKNRLEQLGMVSDSRVHTSRLKLGLLSAFPDLKAHVNGRNVMLSFHSDVGMAITKACSQDSEREAMCLARAARIVRREMFSSKWMVLYVHRNCTLAFSLQQQLTIWIITPPLLQQRSRFMAQAFHYFSIHLMNQKELIVVSWSLVSQLHLLVVIVQLPHSHQSTRMYHQLLSKPKSLLHQRWMAQYSQQICNQSQKQS